MNARNRRVAENPSESSFEITLEETLKSLHERRSEINSLLRSLEAEKREGSEHKLKADEASYVKDRSELVGTGRSTRRNPKVSPA